MFETILITYICLSYIILALLALLPPDEENDKSIMIVAFAPITFPFVIYYTVKFMKEELRKRKKEQRND